MSQFDLSTTTQASLLLTSRLRQADSATSPLTPSEYLGVVKALKELDMEPGDLFDSLCFGRLADTKAIESGRVESLLARGLALAMALEAWAAQGIWVVGWRDADYPTRYKERLKAQAPPILYGIGDRSLLGGGGLAIVGSRDVDEPGVLFARNVARFCADEEIPVISGGARGVDSEAMLACIDHGGKSVGVLADSLARQAVSGRAREAIVDETLLLLSPFEPESRFFISSAMARNKLIYTLADYALVISSDYQKGGTWSGATENLKRGWVPLFVRRGPCVPEGNLRLTDAGAIPMDEDSVLSENILEMMQEQSQARALASSEVTKPSQPTLPLFSS